MLADSKSRRRRATPFAVGIRAAFCIALLGLTGIVYGSDKAVIIGSKKFTESYVLGEIAKRGLRGVGVEAEHKQGMGGTIILWEALESGAITAYPEYTGTIQEEILKAKGPMDGAAMRAALAAHGVGMTGELGFNNTYALVTRAALAGKLGLQSISDIKTHPELKFGLTHEFLDRQDGWKALSEKYGLHPADVRGIDHGLGYAALKGGDIDLKDAYSTDAKIGEYQLFTLRDDLNYFPQYKAVFLYRLEADPKVIVALEKFAGTIDEAKMIRLNGEAERLKDYSRAAALYFSGEKNPVPPRPVETTARKITRLTLRHLELVGLSLLLAILAGIPLGILAARPGPLGHLILGTVSVIQTVPSLALLALLVPIPFLGISTATAVVALFLYSLLPIIRNTATGLQEIPPGLRESAAALGLEPRARLRKIFLPMASRTILAGIKTSAVINVGTATLAALIGAGGLGEPILSGLNLNDVPTLLQGAVPAALLAVVVQVLFEGLDRVIIPRGLRLRGGQE
jgi:osmoprotectant transport system permease protein